MPFWSPDTARATILDDHDARHLQSLACGATCASIAAERAAFASGDLDFRAALAARVASGTAYAAVGALAVVEMLRTIPHVQATYHRYLDPDAIIASAMTPRMVAEISMFHCRTLSHGGTFKVSNVDISDAAWLDYRTLSRLRPNRRSLSDGIDPDPSGPLGSLWPSGAPNWYHISW